MKKIVAVICSLFFVNCVFAQNFSAKRNAFVGMYKVAEANDVIKGTFDIKNFNPLNDTVDFDYSWTQISGKGILSSAIQYKIRYQLQTTTNENEKTFSLVTDGNILSRSVNKDGSEKTGTPTVSGVSYTWVESKSIMGKEKLLKAVKDDLTKKINEAFSVSDSEYKDYLKKLLLENTFDISRKFKENSFAKFLENAGLLDDENIITSSVIISAVGENCGNELQFDRYIEKNSIINRTIKLSCVVNSVDENSYGIGETAKYKYMIFTQTYGAFVSLYTNNDDVIDYSEGTKLDVEGKIIRVSLDKITKVVSFSIGM